MATRTRIQPLDRSFELALRLDIDPAQRSKQFAAFAQEEIDIATEENRKVFGRDVERTVFVDGREGVSLESVSPTGAIVARFEISRDLLEYVAEHLIKGSPVRSGDYARSHILLADGVEVRPGEEPPAAERYVFVNSQPYARKIEGSNSGSPLSRQSPQGVYEVVAAMAARRYGNVGRITFGWASFAALGSSALETWAGSTGLMMKDRRGRARKKQKGRDAWLRRQPAIFVEVS